MSNTNSINRKLLLYVGLGGMIGASLRYSISILFIDQSGFPVGTLIVNWIGCFLLSYILNHSFIKQKLSPYLFAGGSIGIIGSFTTFSTFAVETIQLMENHVLLSVSYIFLSVIGGLFLCYLGFRLAIRKQEFL